MSLTQKTRSVRNLVRSPVALALAIGALGACAAGAPLPTSEAKLREATAIAIAGIDPAKVVISDVDRQAARISWRVTANAKSYACDADDSYRLPQCQQET